jgi:hypothetical protein
LERRLDGVKEATMLRLAVVGEDGEEQWCGSGGKETVSYMV